MIDELKQEHKFITTTFKRIKSVGVCTKEGQTILLSAREALLAHLEKEDSQLYPVLQNEARGDKALEQTLIFFCKRYG